MRPCDQYRGEWMAESEIDTDAPACTGMDRVWIERLHERRQQFQRKHRAGAELRRALEPRLSLVLRIGCGKLLATFSRYVLGLVGADAEYGPIG